MKRSNKILSDLSSRTLSYAITFSWVWTTSLFMIGFINSSNLFYVQSETKDLILWLFNISDLILSVFSIIFYCSFSYSSTTICVALIRLIKCYRATSSEGYLISLIILINNFYFSYSISSSASSSSLLLLICSYNFYFSSSAA